MTDEDSGLGRVPDVLDAAPGPGLILHGGNDFAQSLPLGDVKEFRQGTFFWDYDTMLRGLLFVLHPGRSSSAPFPIAPTPSRPTRRT